MEVVGGVLSVLPEWGTLGAFILTVGMLVCVFFGALKYMADIQVEAERQCQDRLQRSEERLHELIDRVLTALQEHSVSNERLANLIKSMGR